MGTGKQNKTSSVSSVWLSFIVGAILALMCLSVHFVSTFAAKYIGQDIAFNRVDSRTWTANLKHLQAGAYLASVGRPRGICDLFFREKVIGSTRSTLPDVQGNLLLSGSFDIVGSSSEDELKIRCEPIEGFRTSLMHPPVVAGFLTGTALQLCRAFAEMIFGPLVAIILIFFLIYDWSHGRGLNRSSPVWPHMQLGAASLIYSLSLAYYSRLFLPGLEASSVHLLARTILSISYAVFVGSYVGYRSLIFAFNGLIIGAVIVAYAVFPDNLEAIDDYLVISLPLTTAALVFDLFRVDVRHESLIILRYITIARILVQLVDVSIALGGVGVYSAPYSLALTVGMVALVRLRDNRRIARIDSACARLMQILRSNASIKQTLLNLAIAVHRETTFTRISAYIDCFSLGLSDVPFQKMLRVMDSGYTKATKCDEELAFSDGRGLKMKSAIELQQITLNLGDQDQAYFINAPLGRHACLNLSDDSPLPFYKAFENLEIMSRLFPYLEAFSERLIDAGTKQGFALERLRSLRGDGTFKVRIGAIFADVNDFSSLTRQYGTLYAEFISAVYLPAMCRTIRAWAVREFSRGDEVYLVIIDDLIQDGSTLETAVQRSIEEILRFVDNEGTNICTLNGFPSVSLSVGAGIGPASLICDSMQVRTSGETINLASRLREAAAEGEALVHSDVARALELAGCSLGEPRFVLVKKDHLLAFPFRSGIRPGSSSVA